MSIVLVTDEERNIEVLRTYLSASGARPIFACRNRAETMRILAQRGERIRVIVLDLEFSALETLSLLGEIGSIHELRHTSLLGLSSILSGAQLAALRARHPRIDGWLQKPFGRRRFLAALSDAVRRRAAVQNQIAILTDDMELRETLQTVHARRPGHWKSIHFAKTALELEGILRLNRHFVGGLVLDPRTYAREFPTRWMSKLAKSSSGQRMVFACLSQDPLLIGELRQHCHFFLDPGLSSVLELVSRRLVRSWELSLAVRRARHSGQAMLEIDRNSPDGNAIQAHRLLADGRTRASLRHSGAALRLNPCLAHAHVAMLRASTQLGDRELQTKARQAHAFCPRVPGLAREIARVLSAPWAPRERS